MVDSYTDIAKKIVASDAYQAMLVELQESLSIPLEQSYEGMLAEFDGESLSLSQLDESDIIVVLHNESQQIKVYSEKNFGLRMAYQRRRSILLAKSLRWMTMKKILMEEHTLKVFC